ncbi:hypothetical protein PHPALM_29279 [Phytophthora palmivora]|uniref:Uncharacterized protein n=1 Tax=Phytophthora palmivora TaxID=4796 RepID=A0A2P4X817_9STRA|nr:hypothetical protein PHPALM_29279 [Phytophthora palmivora]
MESRHKSQRWKDKTSERLIGDEACGPGKVVILAVDCASGLSSEQMNVFENTIVQGAVGGIFALLADQKTNMAGFNATDISSKPRHSRETVSFPSFVLTSTKDVFWRKYVTELGLDEIAAYKFVVTHTQRSVALEALLSMGRPLWTSTFNGCTKKEDYCTYMAAESTIEFGSMQVAGRGELVGMQREESDVWCRFVAMSVGTTVAHERTTIIVFGITFHGDAFLLKTKR